MFIASLIPALLLAAAIARALLGGPGSACGGDFALLASMVVCATHAAVLVMYPIRHTKPLALLLGVMACVSLLCLFLLLVASQPNVQVHGIGPAK